MPEEEHEVTKTYMHYESDYDWKGEERTHTYKVRALPLMEALEAMTQHTLAHPTHGLDCACKDRFIVMANNHCLRDWEDRTPEQRKAWIDNLYLLCHWISRRNY